MNRNHQILKLLMVRVVDKGEGGGGGGEGGDAISLSKNNFPRQVGNVKLLHFCM